MKEEDIKIYVGKRVKILLSNNFVYTAVINVVSGDCIKIVDKFDNNVLISIRDITMITEIKQYRGEKK
tara:strand:- start:3137 stop:3340 length:204 start_codon:yes stop_codon:yes gene_type:complete